MNWYKIAKAPKRPYKAYLQAGGNIVNLGIVDVPQSNNEENVAKARAHKKFYNRIYDLGRDYVLKVILDSEEWQNRLNKQADDQARIDSIKKYKKQREESSKWWDN